LADSIDLSDGRSLCENAADSRTNNKIATMKIRYLAITLTVLLAAAGILFTDPLISGKTT
jgi:hypothetical protein